MFIEAVVTIKIASKNTRSKNIEIYRHISYVPQLETVKCFFNGLQISSNSPASKDCALKNFSLKLIESHSSQLVKTDRNENTQHLRTAKRV